MVENGKRFSVLDTQFDKPKTNTTHMSSPLFLPSLSHAQGAQICSLVCSELPSIGEASVMVLRQNHRELALRETCEGDRETHP